MYKAVAKKKSNLGSYFQKFQTSSPLSVTGTGSGRVGPRRAEGSDSGEEFSVFFALKPKQEEKKRKEKRKKNDPANVAAVTLAAMLALSASLRVIIRNNITAFDGLHGIVVGVGLRGCSLCSSCDKYQGVCLVSRLPVLDQNDTFRIVRLLCRGWR